MRARPKGKYLRELLVALLANGLGVPGSELTLLEELLTRVAVEVLLVVRLVEELLATYDYC